MAKAHKNGHRPPANSPSTNASDGTQTSFKPTPTASKTADKGQGHKHKGPSKARKKHKKKPIQQEPTNSTNSTNSTRMASLPGVDPYGMEKSFWRLIDHGFHPEVTHKTPLQVADAWAHWLDTEDKQMKTKRWCYLRGLKDFLVLTRGPFVWRGLLTEAKRDVPESDKATGNTGVLSLKDLLQHVHTGPHIIENIFEDGGKTALRFARTSRSSWHSTTLNVKIWDSTVGTLVQDGHSRVFVAMVSKYTVGEIRRARVVNPSGVGAGHPDAWKHNAIDMEEGIFDMAAMVKTRCRRTKIPFWADRQPPELSDSEAQVSLDIETAKVMRALKPVFGMWRVNQFVNTPKLQVYVAPLRQDAESLRAMMVQIHTQRAGIRVLHFHKTPLLDRRMLSIILRACTNVVMLGVYDCPLIHFGDVICILDLIFELNICRRLEKKPEIEAFDFFPHFNEGMPYESEHGAKYGLTWNPLPLELTQRGFFCILLKAFMKAKNMGVKLLFEEGKAFYDYLYRLPNTPFGVLGFLDAMYRYLDVDMEREDRDNDEKRAIYDVLKPVRLGLTHHTDKDYPHWYSGKMGKHKLFCASCGYDMFQEFFTAASCMAGPLTRVCAGCYLQRSLDEETDHLKKDKRKILDQLCPEWDKTQFNIDAPVLEKGHGLISLVSILTQRPPLPTPFVGEDGVVRLPRCLLDFARDQKTQFDSLRNLPTLANLTQDPELWADMLRQCNRVDMYCRAVRQLRNDYPEGKNNKVPKGYLPFAPTRIDGAMPDHIDEGQKERAPGSGHDLKSAYKLGLLLLERSW